MHQHVKYRNYSYQICIKTSNIEIYVYNFFTDSYKNHFFSNYENYKIHFLLITLKIMITIKIIQLCQKSCHENVKNVTFWGVLGIN